MADTNYIGVAMGLDVTDLKSGLSEANKSIQLANSEFKKATGGMDDWRKSTEGLNAKVKQLDSVLGSQKSKLSGLQAEYDKLAKEPDKNAEAMRRLQVQINNQTAAVKTTEKELKNYKDTLKQAEDGTIDLEKATLKNGKAFDKQAASADEASEGTSKLGGAASAAIGGIAALGAAVTGVIAGFLGLAESTREFREDQAKLNSAFQAASLSANSASETYKTLFGAIGESDTAVEAAQQIALLANSEEEAAKWAELATGVVGKFGDALKAETFYEAANETLKLGEATGAYTQMLEQSGYSVDTFNAGLAALSTEEEKQAYMLEISNQLLGEAGAAYNEVAGDIIKAREAEAGLNQATAELGAIAEPIMTTLKNLAAEVLTSITPFVELIGEGLTGAFEGSAGAAETLAEGIGGVLSAIGDRLINMIPTILNVVLELIPSIIEGLLEALPQVLDVIIDLVVQIIDLLSEMLPQILTKISELLPLLLQQLIEALPQIIEAILQLVLAIVEALPDIITNIINALPQLIDSIITAIVAAIPLIVEAAIQLFMAIIEAIPVIIDALAEALPDIIDTIIEGLIEALPLLLDAAIELFTAIIEAIPEILPKLIATLPRIINTIVTTLGNNAGKILTAGIDLFLNIVKAIPQMLGTLIQNIPQIISAIVEGLANGAKELLEAGKHIVEGIWEGIKSAANWLKDKIKGFAGNVAGWFKKTFKINSPSKLMADEIGLFVGEGIGAGIIDSMPYVKKDLAKFSNFVGKNLGGIKAGLSVNASGNTLTGNGIVGGSGTTVVNAGMTVNYNGTLSRKELRKIEQDNDRRVITKLKLGGV